MEISIGVNHQAQCATWEYTSQHFRAEAARLQAELRYVLAQQQRIQAEAAAFISQVYQVDVSRGFTLDSARGLIVVPDQDPVVPQEEAATPDD